MKQGKIVNINVKVRLNRKPSKKEKMKLVELISNILDVGSGCSDCDLYSAQLREENYMDSLKVDHHYVTERKMGRIK